MEKNKAYNYSQEFYETDRDYFNEIENKQFNDYWFKDYLSVILSNTKSNDKILECGCGTGITTASLYKKRRKVLGIDFSKKFIAKANQRGKFFRVMDITNLNLPAKEFDLVCSADLIEHIHELEKAMSEMDWVLKDKGILVLQCPNLFTNFFSVNYKKTLKNRIKKISNLFLEIANTKLRTIKEYELDVVNGDKDAYNLISPIWLKKYLEKKGYKIRMLNTYALYFKPNILLRGLIFILSKLPLTKYLGGRIILVAQKNPNGRNKK